VNIEGLRVVQWTDFFKDFMSDISFVRVPIVGRAVQDEVQFDPLRIVFQLFSQHYIFF
jgi:hypothetical protein